jgi:D-arabinose 1-dehydrogenase-like Zn-dependent alcohol dehydrogenase
MERSRHASHLASRLYRGGIPDLGGGDKVAIAGAGGGVAAAVSVASAMARVSLASRDTRRKADAIRGGAKEGRTGGDSGAEAECVWGCLKLDAN